MKELRGVVEKYKEHLNKGKQELMNSRMSRDIRQTKIFEPAKKEKVKYVFMPQRRKEHNYGTFN